MSSEESGSDFAMDDDDYNGSSAYDDDSEGEDVNDVIGPTSDYEDDFTDIKNDAPRRKAYEVAFKVLSLEDIETRQNDMAEHVSALLNLDKSQTASLLHAYKWHDDSLIERYMEDPDKVLANAGVAVGASSDSSHSLIPAPRGFNCFICCTDADDDMMTFSLSCNHRTCISCYQYYLTQKIVEEGESRTIRCPGGKCGLLVDEAAVRAVVERETFQKYRKALVETFVNDHELLCWCPSPNCNYAIECNVRRHDLTHLVPTVKCKSGHVFCFGCGEEDHQPSICALTKMWSKKCQDDSETSNWIAANTKDCPKCHSMIEKNGGCNHMTCKKCRHEFCWICMGPWIQHGSSYYNCSRYDADDAQKARTEQDRSRAELDRYLHYYNRHTNHQQSIKLEKDSLIKMEKKMREMQEQAGMSWIEVQFLRQAFQVLSESRHTLEWAYAFAFYLKKSNMTTIFEDNQRDLEVAVENLSELFEGPGADIVSKKILLLDKCSYVANRRSILLEHAAKGLADGTWEFMVDVE
jgi:ariadne-1